MQTTIVSVEQEQIRSVAAIAEIIEQEQPEETDLEQAVELPKETKEPKDDKGGKGAIESKQFKEAKGSKGATGALGAVRAKEVEEDRVAKVVKVAKGDEVSIEEIETKWTNEAKEAKEAWRMTATKPSKVPVKAVVDCSSTEPAEEPYTFTIGTRKCQPPVTPSCPPQHGKLSQSADADSTTPILKSGSAQKRVPRVPRSSSDGPMVYSLNRVGKLAPKQTVGQSFGTAQVYCIINHTRQGQSQDHII